MNIVYYKEQIEKTAGVKENALAFASKHKGLLAGAGLGGAGLGAAYLASPREEKEKIKNGVKTVGKSVVTAQANGHAQDMVKNIGGLIGTAAALKSGKSLGKAVATGGLKGMAIGDIAGSATIPTYQLYKKHKKEFGTAPDAKSVATIMSANVGPTAALWGGIYGLKHGAKHMANKSGRVAGAVKRGGDAVNKITDNLADGVGDIVSAGKKTKQDYRAFIPKKPKEIKQYGKRVSSLTPEELQDYKNLVSSFNSKLDKSEALLDSVGGPKGAAKVIKDDIKGITGGAGKALGAFAPLTVAAEAAALPTYFATPENIINAKKRKQQNIE